jgi:hypothetical protein
MTAEEEDIELAKKAMQLTDQNLWDGPLVLKMLIRLFAWRYPQVRNLLTQKREEAR